MVDTGRHHVWVEVAIEYSAELRTMRSVTLTLSDTYKHGVGVGREQETRQGEERRMTGDGVDSDGDQATRVLEVARRDGREGVGCLR